MNGTSDEPPTSAVLLDNCYFSQVIFNNVEKFYVPGEDITCYYTLTQNIDPRGKDWVGIFQVGWKTTRECYTFMWAPLPGDIHRDTPVQQQICFKACYLPKDDEYYQFCYVDEDGMVRGASVPFQFRAEAEDDILVVTTQGEMEKIELQHKNLLKEKEELQASCAGLQKQNSDLQEELKNTQDNLESLRSNTENLELELNSLKKEKQHLKELDDCREAELHELKAQIQNVISDKEQLDTRLKTALDHMDQLQGEMEKIELQNKNLLKEKEELQASCAGLQKQNSDLQEELKNTQNNLESLRSNTENLELELNSLKKEKQHLKELDDCRKAELHELKAQIQNVISDKEQLDTRLKTALDHMDQLQSQVLSYEKEVENLSLMDRDKAEELEHLKEENQQLRMSRSQQQQNSNLIKELEEQKGLVRVLQARKKEADEENQKLRKQNDNLLRHLSQASSPAQTSIPASELGGLLFGNPYYAAGANLGAGAADASLRKCPMCNEVFPEDIETSQYEAHVHSHLLECPFCSETFEKSNKQVFDDHMFCHDLE
ncbi:calcium-binding and coiled-coil domain-containing protein 2 isoform X2 [Strix aluco]|uniref:calcium-binding and coiled-coil domain-containing protein 2 isoform X2 n=1 Tax=Strix aluco TaxID=111821 RepID=UPI003DA6B347